MTHRETLKRLLERAGFVHVAGWVRKEDAPAIRRKIEAAKDEIAAVKGNGVWVLHDDMNPHTNVANRLYRTDDGSVRRAYTFPLEHRPQAWFFPAPEDVERIKGDE